MTGRRARRACEGAEQGTGQAAEPNYPEIGSCGINRSPFMRLRGNSLSCLPHDGQGAHGAPAKAEQGTGPPRATEPVSGRAHVIWISQSKSAH